MNDELKVSYLNSVLASGIELIGLVERPWSTERRGISPLFFISSTLSYGGDLICRILMKSRR